MAVFKCKMCGGELDAQEGMSVAECQYCGTKQTLPKLDDDEKLNLYDRANHFRRNNDYDKAMSIYEKILEIDRTDAEAYWCLVLCKYGIEYVDDPATHKRIPTVNRAQFTSIFDDEDYKSAIQYADGYQKSIYEEEATAINEIQKGILSISQKEEPFDIFICYKETDNNGNRTIDSVLAQDLYYQLKQDGFKVFFSRITLEDKLGVAYEPYIFAALNSAKVMVVIGTKPEHFNSAWVKNEWSRYLSLIKNGAKKILIPAYRDMDPYDLPEEFSHLQAQDMSKLGFMQDLLHGIKKITEDEISHSTAKETVVINNGNANTASLLKRAFMFLEDGDWISANEYCEKVLDVDPENAEAYLGKLMAEIQVKQKEGLKLLSDSKSISANGNYEKIKRFGSADLINDVNSYIAFIDERNENVRKQDIYDRAVTMYKQYSSDDSKCDEASSLMNSISGFKDADEKAAEFKKTANNLKYSRAFELENQEVSIQEKVENLIIAISLYNDLESYRDCQTRLQYCKEQLEIAKNRVEEEKNRIYAELSKKKEDQLKKTKIIASIVAVVVAIGVAIYLAVTMYFIPNSKYNEAILLMNQGKYQEATAIFDEIKDYKDSPDEIKYYCYNEAVSFMNKGDYINANRNFIKASGYKDSAEQLRKLNAVSMVGCYYTVGLKSDGTVVAVGRNDDGQCDVQNWTDIVSIAAGDKHTVGLKSDGTVVAVGYNDDGQCDVQNWTDIVSIAAGRNHTVGLKSDGTVVAVGGNYIDQCDVQNWTDIVSIAAICNYTVGLKSDGTVVAVGDNTFGQCDVQDWTDIVAISAAFSHTVGLKSDGTVVAVGYNDDGQCDVQNWTDIVAISAALSRTVGLKSDGTVVAVGRNDDGQCDVQNWTDIVSIAAGDKHTVGLKSDGTVVAVGYNDDGQCDVQNWTDIKQPIK